MALAVSALKQSLPLCQQNWRNWFQQLLVASTDFPPALCSATEIMAVFFLAEADKNINTTDYMERLRN